MSVHVTNTYTINADIPAGVLKEYEAAVKELVGAIRKSQPDTWLYTVLQDASNPLSFTHYAIYKDNDARKVHHDAAVTNAKKIIEGYHTPFTATIFTVLASQSVLSKPTGQFADSKAELIARLDEIF